MIVLQDGVALGVSGSPSGGAGGALSGSYPNPGLATSQSAAITWGGAQTFSAAADFDAGATIATGQTITGDAELTLAATGSADANSVVVKANGSTVVQFHPDGTMSFGAAGRIGATGINVPAGWQLWFNNTYALINNVSSIPQFGNATQQVQLFGGGLQLHPHGAGVCVSASGFAVASAALEVDSTTQGFLPPVMTTTQKNAIASPATGLVVFDSTLGKLCVFSTTWQTVTSA